MSTIVRILTAPAAGGYCIEDQSALQSSPAPLEAQHTTTSSALGVRRVREIAEAVSVGVVLDDGRVAWGDCVADTGKAGHGTAFRTEQGIATVHELIAPVLVGQSLTSFRDLANAVEGLVESVPVERVIETTEPEQASGVSRRDLLTGKFLLAHDKGPERLRTEHVVVIQPIHTAVRYGLSQALLAATALSRGLTPAEVIAAEWGLPLPSGPVPICALSSGDRYAEVDRVIVRRLASLGHRLGDNVPEELGSDGDKLVQYARWLKKRIQESAGADYHPTIHLDVHGTLGQIVDNSLGRVLGLLYALESAVKPYALRVECPVLLSSREAQMDAMRTLRQYVHARGMQVQIVADEWVTSLDDITAFADAQAADMIQIKMPALGGAHNAVDAILACKQRGVGASLSACCADTDLSARVSIHVALAARLDAIMAKPGMGLDDAVTLTQNEMSRILAEVRWRQAPMPVQANSSLRSTQV